MSKMLLVAKREFVENVRTKTFWIGILSFPVLLALTILVPIWLEKAKDARKYAVIDESGWLVKEVEQRARVSDLKTALRLARAKPEVFRKMLPNAPDSFFETLKSIPDEQFEQFARTLAAGQASGVDPFSSFGSESSEKIDPAEIQKALSEWYLTLSPDEARKIASNLARSRYQRIEVTDLGSDSQASIKKKIDEGELFAYIVVGKDPISGSEGCKYVSNNLTDDDLKDWFSSLATEAVRERRIEKANIDPVVAKQIQEPLDFESKKVSKAGAEEKVETQDMIRQWAPVAFVYLLWISVFTIAQMLLTNTIEEKSNRIIEVLLSSVSPLQLMAGKIAGIAATGLTVIGSWVVFFLIGVKVTPKLLGTSLPFDLSVVISDPVYLPSFVAYFFLGYLLYAAVLVGMGSVCNSLKEAQNLLQPVFILLIVPLLAMMPISRDPNGTLAKVLSYIPPFTPFVMMNRSAAPPTLTEYAITSLLLIVTIVLAMWGAAKIFRIGILMTGKPPKIREILQWMKAPVGAVAVRKED